jgi:sec-independent protein translocase protein TatA
MVPMDIEIYRAAIGGLGPWELAIILLVVLVVFGAGKLPKVGSSIGEALKNFKKSVSDKDEKKKDSPDQQDKG